MFRCLTLRRWTVLAPTGFPTVSMRITRSTSRGRTGWGNMCPTGRLDATPSRTSPRASGRGWTAVRSPVLAVATIVGSWQSPRGRGVSSFPGGVLATWHRGPVVTARSGRRSWTIPGFIRARDDNDWLAASCVGRLSSLPARLRAGVLATTPFAVRLVLVALSWLEPGRTGPAGRVGAPLHRGSCICSATTRSRTGGALICVHVPRSSGRRRERVGRVIARPFIIAAARSPHWLCDSTATPDPAMTGRYGVTSLLTQPVDPMPLGRQRFRARSRCLPAVRDRIGGVAVFVDVSASYAPGSLSTGSPPGCPSRVGTI